MTNSDRRPQRSFWAPRYWPVWFALGFLRLVCLLPHRARLRVGFTLGRIGHRLAGSRRAITRRNIELCFPELDPGQRDELALKHFEALGASFVEMGMGRWSSQQELDSLMQIEGVEHVNGPASEGRGVILLSAHFTTLESTGRVLSKHLPPFDAVYRRHKNAFMTEILRSGRELSARTTIEKNDIKRMIRSLREGIPVWYAPDQSFTGKQSAVIPFFGVPAMTNTATGVLGKLGKAVAVPYFPERLADGSYRLRIMPALEGFPSDDPVADTEQYVSLLEEQIRRCPEQYYWIHKKFKKRPPSLPDAYAGLDALK